MPELAYYGVAFFGGLIGLVWSADRFVDGSVSLAYHLGLSKLVVGVTIVSIGTSAPEVMISFNAAAQNAGDLAIGNALGSNIANVGLVLGVTALVARLPVQRSLLYQELPILLGATGMAGVFIADAQLSRFESVLLLTFLPVALGYLLWIKKRYPTAIDAPEPPNSRVLKAVFWFITGLLLLMLTSRLLVWGATQTATHFGISPLLIGLTAVAVGTSLPELAASVASALRGHHDIALGNIIGSNLFNLLVVMAIPGLFHSLTLETPVITRDFAVMAGLTIALLVVILRAVAGAQTKQASALGTYTGLLFLTSYCAYYYVLFKTEMP